MEKKEYDRQYRLKHLVRIRGRQAETKRVWRALHPGENKKRMKEQYWKNRDKRLAAQNTPRFKLILSMYYLLRKLAFPEMFAEKQAGQNKRRERDPRRISYRKEYIRRPEVRERRAQNAVTKRRNNLGARLLHCLRNRITAALRGRGTKAARTIALLGCEVDEFKIYLESKWDIGMSWENYGQGSGKWNIDHIMPCAIFDFTKSGHQKRCFHFSNQQPLWEPDNIRKKDKIITPQFNLL